MSDTRLRLLLTRLGFSLIVGLIIVFQSPISLGFQANVPHQEPVPISILLPAYQAPLWGELITDFNKVYPNISIKITETTDATDLVQDDYIDKLKPKPSQYDLVYMDIIWVPKFAEKELLENLNQPQYMSPEEFKELKADFLPKDWNGGFYKDKDKLYRIPFHSDVGVLFYRKDLLKNPRETFTFDDLMKISDKLHNEDPKVSGYVWQGWQYEGLVAVFVEVLEGYNGFWIKDDKVGLYKVGLYNDEAIRAVKFLRDTIKNKISPSGVTTFTEREASSVFEKGEAVFLRNWPYWAETNGSGSEIRDKSNFVPMVNEGNKTSRGCQGGWGLGIANNSKHKQEAWKAIKFFTSVATQKKYALKTGNMPSRLSLFNDLQLVKKYSYYPRLLKISQNSVLRPSIPEYSEASKILQKSLSSILNEAIKITDEKIEEEMKMAATETCKLLKKSHDVNCQLSRQ